MEVKEMYRKTEEVNLLCKECSAKDKEGLIDDVNQLCAHCQEVAMTRFCWECMTAYATAEEAGIEDGMCKACREVFSRGPS